MGFSRLFESHDDDRRDFNFNTVYHNGIVERKSASRNDSLGPRSEQDAAGRRYVLDVVDTFDDARVIIDDPQLRGRKKYPNLLRKALNGGFTGNIRSLSIDDGYLPGYEEDKELSLQILGPIPEKDDDNKKRLRWLGDVGKTKTGIPSSSSCAMAMYPSCWTAISTSPPRSNLLEHYTALDPNPQTAQDRERLLAAARPVFEVDLAKACHRGSADFTELFLEAINSSAVVISSGDAESHSHPRPDALGAFGKYAKGQRPLIFSTELARSPSSSIKDPLEFRAEIDRLSKQLHESQDDEQRQALKKALDNRYRGLERRVAVYGMIALRTDGQRVLITQKLEKQRSRGQKWDLYLLEPDADGKLQYVSKH